MRGDLVGVAVPKMPSMDWHPAKVAPRPVAVPVASKEERNPRRVEPEEGVDCAEPSGLHKQDNLLVESIELSGVFIVCSLTIVVFQVSV